MWLCYHSGILVVLNTMSSFDTVERLRHEIADEQKDLNQARTDKRRLEDEKKKLEGKLEDTERDLTKLDSDIRRIENDHKRHEGELEKLIKELARAAKDSH